MRYTPSLFKKTIATGAILLLGAPLALAASGDLFISGDGIWLSDNTIVHGQTVKIYAQIGNNSDNDLLGSVQFVNQTTGEQIESDQPVSVTSAGSDTVFVDWTPSAGTYNVSINVYPWDTSADDSSNNTSSFTVTVDYDNDGDGVGNAQDPDDDNDGVVDGEDAFPYDSSESKDT
ncbi:MAG: hypothetical protein Q8P27_03570, partial [Candidatus Peregrinibacteria bacterium]|nr:hypothetical protein [Candidatus Peregrinibacteria bacterium]